ncbi:MAG: hypothetical protein PHP86_16750 [Nevskiales bacterium]|nr:hypothetical protein [Nevskiales bacterium]
MDDVRKKVVMGGGDPAKSGQKIPYGIPLKLAPPQPIEIFRKTQADAGFCRSSLNRAVLPPS